ncbi:hypothetical protein HGRIS_001224 [Hohenbuehelia grisea]|uniref:Uncharacterized protein n=1 Tax=Hohenbuehelia grisea TaxID=104357 RepID=A0ABR3JPP7_9AGAR
MVSTAHFADLWDNMSGTKYAGEYQFDDSTATVMGCTARAPSVRTLIKAIKNKSSAKGAAASRKHAVAMTLEDLTKIMEWSEKQCPSKWFDAKPSCRLRLQFGHAIRNFEACGIQARDITWDCHGPAPYHLPHFKLFLENRKGWQKQAGYEGPRTSTSEPRDRQTRRHNT